MTRWTIRTGMMCHQLTRLRFEALWAALGATLVAWRLDSRGRHIAELDGPARFGDLYPGAERVGPTPIPAELEN